MLVVKLLESQTDNRYTLPYSAASSLGISQFCVKYLRMELLQGCCPPHQVDGCELYSSADTALNVTGGTQLWNVHQQPPLLVTHLCLILKYSNSA